MNRWLQGLGVLLTFMTISSAAWAFCETERQNNIDAAVVDQKKACGRYWGEKSCNERETIADYTRSTGEVIDWVKTLARDERQKILNDAIVDLKAYRDIFAKDATDVKSNLVAANRAYVICLINNSSGQSGSNGSNQQSSARVSSPDSQRQQSPQQNQSAQQQSAQAQQRAQQNQARADQARQGKRRRHEPENEASQCIQPDFGGLYGGMKNTCDFKVWYTYCGYRPKENSWLTGMSCEKQSFGSDSVSPGRTSAAHTKGVEMLYWFACKEPAWTVDTEFVPGQGIRGRCHTVGGN